MQNEQDHSRGTNESNHTELLPKTANESQLSVEMTEKTAGISNTPGRLAMKFVSNLIGKSSGHNAVEHRSLLELAKDSSTTSAQFLAAARAHPEELIMTEESAGKTNHAHMSTTTGIHRYSSFVEGVVTGVAETFSAGLDSGATVDEEKGLTPVHLFLARAADLTFYEIFSLYELDKNCFVRLSTLYRTPVHYLLERNTQFSADVLDALRKCDPKFLLRLDRKSNTPLDRYFKRNLNSRMEVSDRIVFFLCSRPGSWGISALVHSTEAYRSQSTHFSSKIGLGSFSQEDAASKASRCRSTNDHAELPERFRKFLTGSPWEVEGFVRELIVEGSAEAITANIKFLFVILPLRSPTKYGLSSTQGVQLVTRIINTISNIYALESGENSEALKRIWLGALADCAMYAILDEDLLSGMLSNPPSKESLEALSITPLIQTILWFKFRSGPVLIFYGELCLFTCMCTLVLGSMLTPKTSLVTVVLGICATTYFSVREVHHMFDARAKEIELSNEGASDVRSRHRFSTTLNEFRQYNRMSFTESSSPSSPLRTPQTQDWQQNANYRRMSVKLFGTVESVAENTEEDNCPAIVAENLDDDDDNESAIHSVVTVKLQKLSYLITVYLGLSEAWRQNPFNWINLGALLGTWITLLNSAVISITNLSNPQYFDNDRKLELFGLGEDALVTVDVICVSFLGLRALGFLRGTGIKMATFVLMLQEISWNVDVFLVVLGLILVLFAALYHIMLVGETLEDDEWGSFKDSLWKVWGYAVGEIDDTAFPTTSSYFLFTAFALTIVIIMMNILIAIVSDSYTDAMKRSEPLFWRARVDLIAEYEPLLPQIKDTTPGVTDFMTHNKSNDRRTQIPPTWQYRTLQFQESATATTVVFGIVLFELIFVGNLRDKEDTYREQTNANYSYEPSFYWGLGVSAIFLADILLRYYTWSHTIAVIEAQKSAARSHVEAFSTAAATSKIGGFFSNKFRALDSFLVVLDLFLFIIEIVLVNSKVDGKATSKLARVFRLARSAKWIGRLRVLRSLRFFHRLGVLLRKYGQPKRQNVIYSLRKAMKVLEEATDGWEDASTGTTERIKADLGRNTSKVLEAIDKRGSGTSAIEGGNNGIEAIIKPLISDMTIRLESSEATIGALVSKIDALEAAVERNGLVRSVPKSSELNSDRAHDALAQGEVAEDTEDLIDNRIPVESANVGEVRNFVKAGEEEEKREAGLMESDESSAMISRDTEACL